jgi:hypothetical protein
VNMDDSTKWILQAINILFLNYPVRSAIGALVAVLVWVGFDVYPILFFLVNAKENNAAKILFSLMSYLIVHYKTCYDAMRGRVINEGVREIVSLIESSNLSKEQKRIHYSEVITKRIQQLTKEEITEKSESLAGKE